MPDTTHAPEGASTSTALDVRREPAAVGVPLPPMNDHELATLWRTAKALADSGLFKDALKAGEAFAKILAGRDLGLTPFESMGALHVIEGKVEASSDLHATRVRQRDGYDFRVAWLKIDAPLATLDLSQSQPFKPEDVRAVWADEEDLADIRDVIGCAIRFTFPAPDMPEGRGSGVSRFLITDAIKAGLVKDRSGWARFPRNMLYARAMTNGVAWFVPEVMGGVRVYGFGEIGGGETLEDLTAGDPRGPIGSEASDGLPTEVEAIIARARELGHAGLANRDAAAMIVGQGPEYAATWCRNATGELNRLAAGRTSEPEPEDAVVVQEGDLTAGDAQAPDPAPEGAGAREASPQPSEAGDSLDAPGDDAVVAEQAREAMRARLAELRDRIGRAGEDPDVTSEDLEPLESEAASIEAQLSAAANVDQGTLGV